MGGGSNYGGSTNVRFCLTPALQIPTTLFTDMLNVLVGLLTNS